MPPAQLGGGPTPAVANGPSGGSNFDRMKKVLGTSAKGAKFTKGAAALIDAEEAAITKRQMEVMLAEAVSAIRPLVDRLWLGMQPNDSASAIGWVSRSVGVIASCLNPQGALMAVESLFNWYGALPSKAAKDMRLPIARTLRSFAQVEGFREAVLADANKSEHQRLLQLCLAFVREHMNALDNPTNLETQPLCLELALIVAYLAKATTTAVRYDASRWLKPLFIPESLRNAWPIKERRHLLEQFKAWATWREEEANANAEAMAQGKKPRPAMVPKVGSAGEKLFFRIETVSSTAICAMVASGPIAEPLTLEHWLTEDDRMSGARAPWGPSLQRELSWFEKAELEGSTVLRYILAHHFPGLLQAFLERAYAYASETPQLAAAYFHAVVDAILPPDGVALTEERHSFDDHTFASEVKRVAPRLMLFALFHLKAVDHRIRARAFDLTCRLTSSFCEAGSFVCDGPLARWRALYAAKSPAPVLLNEHTVKLLACAPQQCRSLGFGLFGEALGLLLRLQPLRLGSALQVLQLMQVAAPWLQNVLLTPLPLEAIHRAGTFALLRRFAAVALTSRGNGADVEGEALNAFFAGWMELAAAGVGLPKLRRQPPCHSSQERAPHNTEVLLEFLLHISGRSPQAMALAQKLVLGLFAHTPHSIVKLLMSQISRGRLKPGKAPPTPSKPKLPSQAGPNLFSVIGETFKRHFSKAAMSSKPEEMEGRGRQRSVLALSEEPDMNPVLPPAAPTLRGAAKTERVVVSLLRPAQGGLGMGFSDDNCVSALGEGTPSAECGLISMGDKLVEINGNAVRPGEVGAAVRAANPLLPIEFTFLRDTGEFDALPVPEAPAPAAADLPLEDDGLPLPDARLMEAAEEASLLEPSADVFPPDASEREATEAELRHNALQLMTELVRQGFSSANGKAALLEVLPTLLASLVVLFDSQTRSKLDREEHKTLRLLMHALMEGVLQMRRAETGAAIAPFSELREELPHHFLKMLQGLQTKGFKLRWPRLFADSTALTTTPDVKAAFEVTNFIPVREAISGLFECIEEYGSMPLASDWARVALDWLRSNDTLVRFKALCLLRLLLPRLDDAELTDHLTYALIRALYGGLAELQGVLTPTADLSDPATKEAMMMEKERVARAMAGDTSAVAAEPSAPTLGSAGTQAGRKPPPLALAEEALCALHEVTQRRLEAGTLLTCPGLVWLPFSLIGCPYDVMLAELYPLLVTLLSSQKVRNALSGDKMPTPGIVPNFDGGFKPDAFASGLVPMTLRGLHAVGWWGEQSKTGGSGPRKHHMPLSMQPAVLQALRLVCSVRASQLKPAVAYGAPPPKGAVELMEIFVLQIPAIYEMASGGYTSKGQRLVFEPLFSAARLVDEMAGDQMATMGAPTMQAVLDGFLEGDFLASPDTTARAFGLLVGLATPLYVAFLPAYSQQLATLLTRVLGTGPETFHDAVLLLVATALRQPSAPQYVDHFSHFFKLAIGEEAFAATECLTAAMQASQLAGETVTQQAMALGQAFEKEARPTDTEEAMLVAARSALPALEQVLAHFSK